MPSGFTRALTLSSKAHSAISSSLTRSRELKLVVGSRLVNEDKRDSTTEQNMDMAKALTSPNTVYLFKLQGFTTVTSNGSGITAVSIPFDPSSAGFNFGEWSDLAALFDEVKLHSFSVQLVGYNNTTTSDIFSPMVIGTNLVSSGAPGSEGVVATLTDARYLPAYMSNSSGHTHVFRNTGVIGWSSTASVTDQPYAGCPGSFQLYSNNASVSTQLYKVLVQGYYAFRARA
jgi:hypothetical protein